ncbi:hypothetical protein [Leptothermofonsia sp. ETS-13]
MRSAKIPLPYFDVLLEQINLGDTDVQQVLHWPTIRSLLRKAVLL